MGDIYDRDDLDVLLRGQRGWRPDEIDDVDSPDPTPADEIDLIADAHIGGLLLGMLGIVCVAILLGAAGTFLVAWLF